MLLVVVAVAVTLLLMRQNDDDIPLLNLPGESEQTDPQGTESQAETETQTQTTVQAEDSPDAIILSDGLQILGIDNYAGMYMEDESNETVADVMMILVENVSDKDLQLARVNMVYSDFTAQFEITNLPAGEKIIVLEKNRHSGAGEAHQSVTTDNVVFFDEPMNIHGESLRFSGSNGILEVRNISEKDISGNIYVYYKSSAADLLYGGITFRVVIEGGLPAGQTVQLFTGHYSPETSRIISVVYGE